MPYVMSIRSFPGRSLAGIMQCLILGMTLWCIHVYHKPGVPCKLLDHGQCVAQAHLNVIRLCEEAVLASEDLLRKCLSKATSITLYLSFGGPLSL